MIYQSIDCKYIVAIIINSQTLLNFFITCSYTFYVPHAEPYVSRAKNLRFCIKKHTYPLRET